MKQYKSLIVGLIAIMMVWFAGFLVAQITVEKTIPETVDTSQIHSFTIYPNLRVIKVRLAPSGKMYMTTKAEFLDFWNNTMTASNRTVVKEFIKQLTAIAASVDPSKVTGDFSED